MKKRLLSLIFILMALSGKSLADIIKFETNNWNDRKPLVWSGTLIEIDPDTNLVHFEYKNHNSVDLFQVHVTRIDSLGIDSQDRVNRALPNTRQDIKTSLPMNPHSRRTLELSNENFVADDIPVTVRVRSDRSSDVISLSENILSADIQTVILKTKAVNRTQESFEISRSDLREWIR